MNIREYAELTRALNNSHLADLAGFKVDVYHEFNKPGVHPQRVWSVILSPTVNRIFLLQDIVRVVNKLDIDVAMFTDINRPGCIIFH